MKDKRIIVCDDQQEIGLLIKIIFEKKGCHVVVIDQLESIDPLVQANPDLILMDLQLPGIGGKSAVKQIQKNIALENVPIIIISGNTSLDEISEELKVPYVSKPFQIQQLVNLVSGYFTEK